jgi:hypothetical protein
LSKCLLAKGSACLPWGFCVRVDLLVKFTSLREQMVRLACQIACVACLRRGRLACREDSACESTCLSSALPGVGKDGLLA